MSKEGKNKIVPKMRFPEFIEEKEWDKKSIDKVLTFTPRQVMKPEKPYTRLGIRSHGKGTFLSFNELPEKNSMEYLYEVKPNDLIVNITFAWEGAIAIASENDRDALVSHRFPTFVFDEKEAIPSFFKYVILDKNFIYKLGVISPGGAGRNRVLSRNDFLNLEVNLPKIAEQQKIASCLSSLDDLITAQTQKLNSLKNHKKGLMQQLFPAEGENVPRLRFKEFKGNGEWVLNVLSKCLLQHPDYGINAPAVPFSEDLPTYLRITDISEDGYFLRNNMASVAKDVSEENYLEKGDIVLARTGASVGKSYKYRVEDGRLVFAGFLIRIKPNEEKLNSEFLLQ
ncbi:MAG TPA: restriction endonuclease subunit S, partial [Bacteroidales bacterium]|nr:restriction endonuclease subunit S [Bacteroidales bacterium]